MFLVKGLQAALCVCVGMIPAPHLLSETDSPRNIQIQVSIERVGYQASQGIPTQFSEKTRQFITTVEGHQATILVGRSVPQFIPIRQYLVENKYIDYAVRFSNVGTQVTVVPRIRGNVIEVEITPEVSYEAAEGRTHVIHIEKLSSTVLVPNGATVEIGSVATQSEFFDWFYRSERGERVQIFLTPQILE